MLDHGAQHGVVGREPGHAHALALQVARPFDVGSRDHGRQRALDERADAHDVGPALARQAEVVDVHHRHVGAARRQQLERVGGATSARPRTRRGPSRPHRCRRARRWAGSRARAWPRRRGRHRRRSRQSRRSPAPGQGESGAQRRTLRRRPPFDRRLKVQERGPAAYIAEFVGTLLLVFFITARVRCTSPRRRRQNPNPFIDFSRDRAGARVRAVRADPDARGGLGSALQPGGHRRDDAAAADQAAGRRRSTSCRSSPAAWPARLSRRRSLLDEGAAYELRRRRGLGRAQRQDPSRAWWSRGSARSS